MAKLTEEKVLQMGRSELSMLAAAKVAEKEKIVIAGLIRRYREGKLTPEQAYGVAAELSALHYIHSDFDSEAKLGFESKAKILGGSF